MPLYRCGGISNVKIRNIFDIFTAQNFTKEYTSDIDRINYFVVSRFSDNGARSSRFEISINENKLIAKRDGENYSINLGCSITNDSYSKIENISDTLDWSGVYTKTYTFTKNVKGFKYFKLQNNNNRIAGGFVEITNNVVKLELHSDGGQSNHVDISIQAVF